MDAQVRRSFSRVHTFIALTVFSCISVITLLSHHTGTRTIVQHARREIWLPRQESPTSLTTSTAIVTSIAVVTSSRSPPPSPRPTTGDPSSSRSSSSSTVTSLTGASSSSSSSSSFSSSISSSQSQTSTNFSSFQTSTSTLPTSSSTTSSSTRSTITKTETNARSSLVEPTPGTTLVISNDFLPTSLETFSIEPSSSPTPNPVSGASKSGFWENKTAVSATFAIIALVVVGFGAFVFIVLLKRRNARRQARIHEELFETYTEPDFRSNSPGPSINIAPMDAFARREVTYDNVPSSHNASAWQSQPRSLISFSPVQHPDYYNSPSRFTLPSQSQSSTGTLSPQALRNPDVRDSTGYQPSIDSFYGAGPSSGYKS